LALLADLDEFILALGFVAPKNAEAVQRLTGVTGAIR
jgi:hypothetical protein